MAYWSRAPAAVRIPVGRRSGATRPAPTTGHARIEVEVANFYPAIASRLGKAVYEATQAFVHVLVTHAFLRSLATLELAESQVRPLPAPALTFRDARPAELPRPPRQRSRSAPR